MASPKAPQPCPKCKDVGVLAVGRDVQYCMCPTGRAKKKVWFELPEDLRAPEERISRTVPDLDDLKGVA